jgi:hypothetical protein
LRFVVYVKSDSDIYYNKTSDKAATKWVTSDLGYTLGGPRRILSNHGKVRRNCQSSSSVNMWTVIQYSHNVFIPYATSCPVKLLWI